MCCGSSRLTWLARSVRTEARQRGHMIHSVAVQRLPREVTEHPPSSPGEATKQCAVQKVQEYACCQGLGPHRRRGRRTGLPVPPAQFRPAADRSPETGWASHRIAVLSFSAATSSSRTALDMISRPCNTVPSAGCYGEYRPLGACNQSPKQSVEAHQSNASTCPRRPPSVFDGQQRFSGPGCTFKEAPGVLRQLVQPLVLFLGETQ